MKFSEACDQVGYNPGRSNAPVRVYKYFAYKDGQSFESSSKEEAQKISHLIEQVLANKVEIDQYTQNQNALLNKAIQLWKDNLREEYSHIRESVYNMCYEEAYDRAHAYGYDEVASVLKDVIGFAHKLLSCPSE